MFIGLLWSCTIRQWSPKIDVSACESNFILVLTTAILVWALKWTVHTLAQIAFSTSISAQLLLMFPFDDPRSQPGSLCFALDAWWVTERFPLFFPYFGHVGVSPSFFLISSSLGWEHIPSLATRAAILVSSLVCFMAILMPCCSPSFLTCICWFLVTEFQTAFGYFLHSTFLWRWPL